LSLGQKYLKVLSGLLPTGVVGVSLLLASTAPSAAREEPASAQPPASQTASVSQRLAAIRDAVSTVAGSETDAAKPAERTPMLAWGNWGWGGGWGWPNWNNWHNWNNWGNFWRNW